MTTSEPGIADEIADTVGLLTEALETTERARGHLYQLTGEADFKLEEAIESLRTLGEDDLAERLNRELLGRNVLTGRWTYQIVEEYYALYWSEFRAWEQRVREQLTDGERHLHEARLKECRRSHGHPGHTPGP